MSQKFAELLIVNHWQIDKKRDNWQVVSPGQQGQINCFKGKKITET